jgi:hypothetical protein
MKTLILFAVLVSGFAFAQIQTCLDPAPVVVPRATVLVVNLPADGGTTGCTARGECPNCKGAPSVAISNAKCAQARQIADQSVANANGWNDGGAP